MWRFAVLICLFLMAFPAGAKSVISLGLKNGKVLNVAVHNYVNNNGQQELRFETDNLAKVILGHARDFNGDGVVETFFIFGDDGLSRYERDVPGEDAIARTRSVFYHHAKYSGGDYLIGIGTHVLTFFFIAVDQLNEAQKRWYQDWMDLEELTLAVERNKSLLSREELIYAYNLMLETSHRSLKEFEDAFYKEYPAWWVADAVLWLSGGVVVKWAGKGVGLIGKRLLPRLERLGAQVAARAGIKLALNAYRAQVRMAIKGIAMKGLVGKGGKLLSKGLKNVKAEWKYVAFSAGIQMGVESYVSYDDVYDPDPKVMAENLMSNPEVQENVAISVADSLAMTAAHGIAQTTAGKFALLGIVGASSSLGVGLGLSGSQSKERLALDTAWAVGVDSLQVMLDLHVLHKFQAMAMKAKNPKLKLAGYAIVFVSQAVGYYGYALASRHFDAQEEKQGELKLIPILAEN